MVGAWKRWSGTLALSTEREFERLCLPFLRLFWPSIAQAPPRQHWDQKGIDLLEWSEDDRFPCAVQCKGFVVQQIGADQLRQVLDSIAAFRNSGVKVHTYLIIHNRDGRNEQFRKRVENELEQIILSGQAIRAELWDRQKFLINSSTELEQCISKALQVHAKGLLSYYEGLFLHGSTYLSHVPVREFRLTFKRLEPCTITPHTERRLRTASDLVLSEADTRWTLLTGTFGSGKTTTVLHAAASTSKAPVLIECRTLPSGGHQLNGTSVVLEEGLKSLRILDSFDETDRQVLYEFAGTTFKEMLMSPGPGFALIL